MTSPRPPQSNLSDRNPRVPARTRKGRNAAAVERTIANLRRSDRLVPGDDATIALLRTTAASLDGAEGAYDTAVMGRVHLAAITALLQGHAAPDETDVLDRIIGAIRSA